MGQIDWKQVDIQKEMERAIEMNMRSRRIPKQQEEMIKKIMLGQLAVQDKYFLAWTKGGDSTIMVAAKEHTIEPRKKDKKEFISSQINNRLDELLNRYQEAIERIPKFDTCR